MWQFITLDPDLNDKPPVRIKRPLRIGTVSHALTHRRYEFDVFSADAPIDNLPKADVNRIWISITQLDLYPLPRPHLKIVEMLRSQGLA
jgi:adenine-specific DNA glycosylase